ncbi:MAG: class I SAM-dependent methyltransferase [Chloroflexota bacterium]|nr:MAG: class I SAM-dependent methyltransferase [Chloroflexota bacterium]
MARLAPDRTSRLRARAPATDLARYYDLDLETDPGDLALYLALAGRAGGPVLELAAGTGRVAVPLAAAGFAVTALDLDGAMLARARVAWRDRKHDRRRPAGDLRCLEQDLLLADLGPRFGLVILGLNSLFLLETAERQAAAIGVLARHLRPGGLAAVDVWLPAADELAAYDGRLALEWVRADAETGERVAKLASARYDSATGVVELTTWFDAWPPAGGTLRRTARTDRLRLVGAAELVGMFGAAGLEVETLAGDYTLTPFGPGADRAVVIARRPDVEGGAGRATGPLV